MKKDAIQNRELMSEALKIAQAAENMWINGFGLALAEVNRACDQPSACFEAASAAGLTDIRQFRNAGLEEYDLKELRKILKEKR